jgi:DNA-binding winged helix-turn-helix (wHTH) protein
VSAAVTQAYAFGPFRVDLEARRLLRDGEPVSLSAASFDLLVYFVTHAGELVTRAQLLDALWSDSFVTDNSLSRAVLVLRRALGDAPGAGLYIQTIPRRGYRFVAPVSGAMATQDANAEATGPAGRPGSAAAGLPLDAEVMGLREFVAAVADLETFDTTRLPATVQRLTVAAERLPAYAPVRVALASAGVLEFEARRRAHGARDAIRAAVVHAQRACELDAALPEAWATLAFALTVEGHDLASARAAARRAVMLDPGGWRHHFRLAFASWGDERLRAVARTLALMPGMPFACLAGAMVHVARSAFPAALDLLAQASSELGHEHAPARRLPSAGVEWLRGAVQWRMGTPAMAEEAEANAASELARHDPSRLYSTEFAVNACHWRAGWSFARGNIDAAVGDLAAALRLDPAHARSAVAMAALSRQRGRSNARALEERANDLRAALRTDGRTAEEASCVALDACLRGEGELALTVLDEMLATAPIGHAGWSIPVDPWLDRLRALDGFTRLKHALAQRAV